MLDKDLYLVAVVVGRLKCGADCAHRRRSESGKVESLYLSRRWKVERRMKIGSRHLADIADEGPSSKSERPAGLRTKKRSGDSTRKGGGVERRYKCDEDASNISQSVQVRQVCQATNKILH